MLCKWTAVCLGAFLAWACWSGAEAHAQGGDSFPKVKEMEIGGQKTKLVVTGQAIRKKSIFQVYAVASYIQEGVRVRTAQDLVAADCPKVLQIIMLRSVDGVDMAESLLAVLRQNHPAPSFADEAKTLSDKMRAGSAEKGDHIFLTHIPKVGLSFKRMGGEEIIIRNVAFSRAMWENYFGARNVSEDVKRGLLANLEK